MRNLKVGTYIAIISVACYCSNAWAETISNQQIPNHQEMLTYLLKADMAMQRNMPDVALENYLIVAQYTHDAQVAQLATELAIQTQVPDKAIIAAEIWANAAPDDLQAQLIASTLLLGSNSDKAFTFLNNAFEIKSAEIDQHLLLVLNQLSPEGQKSLVALIYKVAEQRKNDPYAQLAAAVVAAAQLDVANATKQVQLALKIKPDLTSAIELNAKILSYQSKNDTAALQYLEQQLKKYPNNAELRFFYVTALLDNDKTTRAMPSLVILSKDATYGGEAYIIMSEIYIGQEKLTLATDTLKKALPFSNSADKAKFYLGQLAEYNKDNIQAVKWYEGVSENSEFQTQAYLRAASIYAMAGNYTDALDIVQNANPSSFEDQKQLLLTEIDIRIDADDLEQALTNTNKVLAVIPNDIDFLYARSVIYSMQNKPTDAEKDLRTILAMDPENADALNALGFTLANQPSRMNEAMPLLQQALNMNPDNPAFMDSMGWLLYKMGRHQDAIAMLNQAYKLSNDDAIAAHLGEVLWASGKKDAAKTVWVQALGNGQDSAAIKETLQRLQIPTAELQTTKSPGLKPNSNKASN